MFSPCFSRGFHNDDLDRKKKQKRNGQEQDRKKKLMGMRVRDVKGKFSTQFCSEESSTSSAAPLRKNVV